MIEALMLVHVWSLVVAGIAWILQRDSKDRIGARFPSSNVWLILILLCLLPGALYVMPFGTTISIPEIEVLEFVPSQTFENSDTGFMAFGYFDIYLLVGSILMVRTLWRWLRLQRLPLALTSEQGVFTTTSKVPPLTLSWPRRAIVIPLGLQTPQAIIRHERTHLTHRDAEVTLCLLLLQDLMLRSPGVSYLIRQWRLAIELRADQAAVASLTKSERRDYAALLLNGLRVDKVSNETLPCPTARFNSSRGRDIKIRLTGIIDDSPNMPISRWKTTLATTAVGASLLGLVGASASTNNSPAIDFRDYISMDYTVRTPPKLPQNCLALDRSTLKVKRNEIDITGAQNSKYYITVGSVVVTYKVRKNSAIHNVRVLDSSDKCFNDEAIVTVGNWKVKPQGKEVNNAIAKVYFRISGHSEEELNMKLNDFLG